MKTKVLIVPVTPYLTSPDFCSGIRDETAAREWGEKNAYSQVYYLRGKQRVYADRASILVDLQSQAVEQESRQPLALSEQGEIDLFDAGLFLLLMLLILAGLRNVPW